MSSSDLDSFLELYNLSNLTLVASNNDKAAGTKDAEIVYTATADSYFAIVTENAVASQVGNYSLTLAASGASAVAPGASGVNTRRLMDSIGGSRSATKQRILRERLAGAHRRQSTR
jgi:hypothetical protein